MLNRTPSPHDIAHWLEDMRRKSALLAKKQYDAYVKLDRTLKRLTPRQFRNAIGGLQAFNDARDELLYMNGYIPYSNFVYGTGKKREPTFRW